MTHSNEEKVAVVATATSLEVHTIGPKVVSALIFSIWLLERLMKSLRRSALGFMADKSQNKKRNYKKSKVKFNVDVCLKVYQLLGAILY